MPTAVAPRASALTTSAPARTPESNSTGQRRRGLDHVGQAVEGGQAAVGLPAAVVGAVDAVDAGVLGPAGVVGVADALEDQRQVGQRRAARPGRPRSAGCRRSGPVPGPRPAGRPRGRGQAGAEDRVAEVVGQAVAAQLGEVGGREVARAPAGDPGVEGDDDAPVAGRLGALDEALGELPVGRACRAGRSRGCRRTRPPRPPAGRRRASRRPSARRCGRRPGPWPGRRGRPGRTDADDADRATGTAATAASMPNSSTDRSRRAAPTSIRGHQAPAVERRRRWRAGCARRRRRPAT